MANDKTIKNKHTVYCVIGRTSSGKTELSKQVVIDLGMILLKSFSTRGMRKEEIDNPFIDHTFITEAEADTLLGNSDVVAYTKINNVRYFATLQQLKEADFYVIDPQGYEALEATLMNWNITEIELVPIYISATKKIRQARYVSRDNCTIEAFEERDNSENSQFNNFEMKILAKDKKFLTSNSIMAHIIKNNGSFEDALKEFKKVIKATK